MKVLPNLRISFLAVLALLLCSCNKNVVYSEYQSFKENLWPENEKAIFDVEINDAQNLHNISIMVRHADSYPFSNLYLFVTSTYPDGKVLTDTMEIMLANNKGEWQGAGAGDIFDLKVPVKKNVRFPLTGKYKFEFIHGMRVDPLPLIMDLGFEIEKVK